MGEDVIKIRIKFSKRLKNNINDVLAGLDATYTEKDDFFEATFGASDTMSVCKQMFLYGDEVEIISPKSVRNEMIEMLGKAAKVYKETLIK